MTEMTEMTVVFRYYSKGTDDLLPSQISHTDFNDLNLEEPGRYISHAGKCHFLGEDRRDNFSRVEIFPTKH